MTPSPSEAARLAVYCYGAETVGPVSMPSRTAQAPTGEAIASGGPPLPPWMASRLSILGWVTGRDALFEGYLNLDAHRVFYGWVCREPDGGALLILRGTQSVAEWAIDAEFMPRSAHPVRGEVETGFWSLFQTLEVRDLAGADYPFAIGVARAVGAGAALTVTGHSLGAALATYAAEALVTDDAHMRVRGRFIASPRPGDRQFAAWFASVVQDYAVYAYDPDIVPRVPRWLGYAHLQAWIEIARSGAVADSPANNHHALTYAWLLDPAALDVLPNGIASAPWIAPDGP